MHMLKYSTFQWEVVTYLDCVLHTSSSNHSNVHEHQTYIATVLTMKLLNLKRVGVDHCYKLTSEAVF